MSERAPLATVEGVAAPLLRDNIDTDSIIPSREIKGTGKTGLAGGLFAGWRYRAGTREPDPGFVLNDARYAHAPILLAGANFGCGSSREHAVWALVDHGIRAIIAPSFAPIFAGNAVRNGLAPIALDAGVIARLGDRVAIDLGAQTVTSGDVVARFDLGAEAKAMLIGGLDAIDLTLRDAASIDAWIAADRLARPWVYLELKQ